eukprot:gene61914-biopygen33051
MLRANTDGSAVRLKDVARIELGGQAYATSARLNGKAAVGIGVQLASSGNALAAAKAVKAKMEELKPLFPAGIKYEIPYDSSRFVSLSIRQVAMTLLEAVVLVFLVMFLFLQNLRYTIIPTIVVPVALLGTFATLLALGFSINVLTMFGMVLVIGIVVNDAIVVVENVERIMSEEGLPPLEATQKAMGQISGAIIGVTVVLISVFVPLAFFSGSVGNIYRQFSAVMVASISFSAFLALSLTPALCATLLKPVAKGHALATTGFFGAFNRLFDRSNRGYQGVVRHMVGRSWLYMAGYAVLVALVVVGFTKIPAGFLPDEDQATLFAAVQLPPGATQDRTLKALAQVEHHFLEEQKDSVEAIFTVAGFSFAGSGQNAGFAFVKLKPWDQRPGAGQKAQAVAGKAMAALGGMRDGTFFAFAPPAVSELGNASGFDLMLQDRGNLGHAALMQARNQLLGALMQEKGLVAVRPNGME